MSPLGCLTHNTTQPHTVSFELYDFNGDGKIDKAELKRLLQASLEENSVPMSEAAMDELVDTTFAAADTNKDDLIDFDEYHQMVIKHPALMKPLTLNVGEIIKEVTAKAAAEAGAAGAGSGAGAGAS